VVIRYFDPCHTERAAGKKSWSTPAVLSGRIRSNVRNTPSSTGSYSAFCVLQIDYYEEREVLLLVPLTPTRGSNSGLWLEQGSGCGHSIWISARHRSSRRHPRGSTEDGPQGMSQVRAGDASPHTCIEHGKEDIRQHVQENQHTSELLDDFCSIGLQAYATRRSIFFCTVFNAFLSVAAAIPAASPPNSRAVRVDGLGSHFIAPMTICGG
jgi:hypothetical protein